MNRDDDVRDDDDPRLGFARVSSTGIDVDDYTQPLWSTTCDYHAIPRQYWNDVLGSIRALGFGMVDVKMLWDRHTIPNTDQGAAEFDFGALDPQLDVVEFARLAASHHLEVCLRPGPRHDDPERGSAGVPGSVVRDPACRAEARFDESGQFADAGSSPLDSLDGPPSLSLASETYLARCERWLEAVAEVVRPSCHPRGPIIAIHLDCADSLDPYERGPGDHHRDARAMFQSYVKGRYERPSILRLTYGNASLDFTAVAPPLSRKERTSLAAHLDWHRFQEEVVDRAFDRLQRAVHGKLPSVSCSLPEFKGRARLQLRFADVEFGGQSTLRYWSAGSAGTAAAPTTTVPLLDVRIASRSSALQNDDALLYRVLAGLAVGARGLSLDPGCESPGLRGSLVTINGEPTSLAGRFAPLLAALERTQFHTLALEPCVHIVLPEHLLNLERAMRSIRNDAATWLTHTSALVPEADDDELARPVLLELRQTNSMLRELEASLIDHGVPFRYANEWELDTVISRAPWTVLPTTKNLPEELVETIAFGRRRGSPFSIGPFVPKDSEPASVPGQSLPLVLGPTPNEVRRQVSELVKEGQLPRRETMPGSVRTLFHIQSEQATDDPGLAVAFVLNTSVDAVKAEVACPGYKAKDALTLAPIPSFAERLQVSLPGEGVRMLELFPLAGSSAIER